MDDPRMGDFGPEEETVHAVPEEEPIGTPDELPDREPAIVAPDEEEILV